MKAVDRNYFTIILSETAKEYDRAVEARSKLLDPKKTPECVFTWDMAERVEKLVGPEGVADYIREHGILLSREKLALKVVDAIIDGEFGVFSLDRTADQTVRTALAILTEGITVAPKQGISKVVVRRVPRGASYLSIYFSGPIRSAGGTESGLILVYGDYIRRRLGLSRYQPLITPSENEIHRFIEELRIHEREMGQFQLNVHDTQIEMALRNLPVEINGVGTGRVEVLVNRDMSRIETNQVRGGALRVLNDGLIGRARKIYHIVSGLGIEGWRWLLDLVSLSPERGKMKSNNVVFEAIAGRPIFSFPDEPSGFRLRYGRASNTGLSAVGFHPATFAILNYFLVPGTQIKMDYPGKGAIAMPVSSISPPYVKLLDGSIVMLESEEQVSILVDQISKVLWLGDILVSFGDFLENSQTLKPSAYVEEWWSRDLEDALRGFGTSDEEVASRLGLTKRRFRSILRGKSPSFKEALNISRILGVPLHPNYMFRWSVLSISQLLSFLSFIKDNVKTSGRGRLILPMDREAFTVLESILIPFNLSDGKIVVKGAAADLLRFFSSVDKPFSKESIENAGGSPLRLLSWYMNVELHDVVGSTIAARMGRPEKAARREMKPLVHVLFPVGNYGGPSRDLITASQGRRISAQISSRKCIKCDEETFYILCPKCGEETTPQFICSRCNAPGGDAPCPRCGSFTSPYRRSVINLISLIEESKTKLRISPAVVKGVRGLTNSLKLPERIEKGMIRAANNISAFKDGTARFDVTNAPLTFFHPNDIHLSPEKARKLGYESIKGDELLPLKVQDVIIPKAAAEYLFNVTRFIDEMLYKVYELPSFYNADTVEDMIGVLVVGLSPHTSVGVIGRIIGFTDSQVLYANPLWHASKRRDCDGDQDSIMLFLDVLINFSPFYLPASTGGEMDAPLFISPVLLPSEVDSQAHNIEFSTGYPKKFYEAALTETHPKEIIKLVKWVYDYLNTKDQYKAIPNSFSGAQLRLMENTSSYRRLHAMTEKIKVQVELSSKLSSVDVSQMVRSVINTHLLPDILGNLRAFTTQSFRCKKCYFNHRRPPLSGNCDSCGGELVQTVHKRGVEKYLNIVKDLLRNYCPDPYLQERVALTEREINLTLIQAGESQKTLSEYI